MRGRGRFLEDVLAAVMHPGVSAGSGCGGIGAAVAWRAAEQQWWLFPPCLSSSLALRVDHRGRRQTRRLPDVEGF